MSNLNNLFLKFNDNIILTSTKKENLRRGRNALRDKIKEDFKDNKRLVPNFCGQGSFMMKTIVNPLGNDDYDIDDGVYLNGFSDKSKDEWPSSSTIHNWIKNAVDGHTSIDPVDKNTCIRVLYASGYHIDLPSYILKDDIAYLAHKKDGWIESDPKAFTDWFIDKKNDKGEQLRRVVKYLKAWKDYKKVDLKGISITILVGEHFYEYEDRDDSSILGTVTEMISELEVNFKCPKPVSPYEDLFDGFSDTKRNNIINALIKLKDSINDAIAEEDEEKASDIMIKQFGDRFPKGKPKQSNSIKQSSYIITDKPGVLNNDGHSA